jgi:RNA polymerase sigma-70 factor, ECF subfamily
VSRPHAADLELATACARGERDALERFDALLRPLVSEAVGRALNKDPVFVEEVRAAMQERLLVAPRGARPKILDYEGKGPLAAWLRQAAVRTALNLQKSARRDTTLDDAVEQNLGSPGDDPELELLKQRCKREFKGAFQAALDRVDASDRELLKWNLVGGESIDKLAERLKVSRATAARKLAAARTHLMELTREQLRVRLKWGKRELDSVVGLVRSQLDLSLQRYLG